MASFLDKTKMTWLNQEEIKKLTCPIYCKEIEFVFKAFPTKKSADPYTCYQAFKEKQ